MKAKRIGLSRRYVTALRKHLEQGPRATVAEALRLGRQALMLRLETLELARIHERALVTLKVSPRQRRLIKHAEVFFSEVISPILEVHRTERHKPNHLQRLDEALKERTAELAATNLLLQRDIALRTSVEGALKKSGQHYAILLTESLALQEGLRHLTHQLLEAQEDERKNISRDLQDEIAQTLLGINVRLLSLKQKARFNTKEVKQEITHTQRLIVKSAQSVRRMSRKISSL